MTIEIPTNEPSKIIAGDSFTWQRQDLSDYLPADGWVLKYVLINKTHKIEITATTSGTGYLVSVTAATSADYNAGRYAWRAYVENTGLSQRKSVDDGHIEVLPDFAQETTHDTRTHVKKTLDAIEAVIETRASTDQEQYTIMGRMLKRTPLEDLLKLRTKYRSLYTAELNAENTKNGKAGKNRIVVKF